MVCWGLVFVDYCGGRGEGVGRVKRKSEEEEEEEPKKTCKRLDSSSRETCPIYLPTSLPYLPTYLPPYPALRTSLPTLKF